MIVVSPLIPTDPTLVVPSLDRSNATTPVVLLGYVLVTLLLLARGVKRSWLRGRDPDVHADHDDEADADGNPEPDDSLTESREGASP
ncbi:hypothetical protein SAMN05216388_100194 [Halorientalis persicus]|uniref:Uncharacterized protein n=1 Tax=Halorientalis persicus TaxID=1367881 RepID=A0A1H8CX33_9EURY|nr:hypothetical protein SAMN05216388_100194 [Halorientalis persicus]